MRISELENKLRKHAETTKSVMQAPFDLNEEIKNMEVLLDVRVKGEEDLALISNAPVLGLIPDLAMESKDSYGYSGYKYSAYSAAYKAESKTGSEEADV